MKYKKSFLEFYKLVLDRVKFDQSLFWKEYNKAIKYLNDTEAEDLKSWVKRKQRSLN